MRSIWARMRSSCASDRSASVFPLFTSPLPSAFSAPLQILGDLVQRFGDGSFARHHVAALPLPDVARRILGPQLGFVLLQIAQAVAHAGGCARLRARHVARRFLHVLFQLLDVARHLVFLIGELLRLLPLLLHRLPAELLRIGELIAERLAQPVAEIALMVGQLLGALRQDRPGCDAACWRCMPFRVSLASCSRSAARRASACACADCPWLSVRSAVATPTAAPIAYRRSPAATARATAASAVRWSPAVPIAPAVLSKTAVRSATVSSIAIARSAIGIAD